MKKMTCILLIMVFIIQSFCVPDVVHGKTLGQLKSELEASQKKYQENENQKELTQSQINSTNAQISNIEAEIKQIYIDISNLDKEIEQLNNDIVKKDKEIKEIINYTQISNGESVYLEYAFGAQDFTDFIYRVAIAEQLTNYNEKLIKEFNQAIEDSKKKQEEMRQKQSDMADRQKSLEEKMASLGKELTTIASTGLSIEDTIEYQKEVIALYESKNCSDNEDISTCGREVLPQGTAFYRPTEFGSVTSEWGTRYLVGDWHEGIDIGVPQGTPVYAVGNGMVALIVRRSSKGGNMVVVHHNINNKTYTSVYAHLLSINVVDDQNVDRNTLIGYSGGGANTMAPNNVCGLPNGTGWDSYTCGEHLHVTIATGLYMLDYTNWIVDLNRRYSIDPRTVINFPKGLYNRWNDRISKY